MARVLWLTAEVPDRRLGGGSIRQARLLEATAATHEVHLAVVGVLDDEELRGSLAGVTELPVPPAAGPARAGGRHRDHLRSFARREPEDCVNRRTARAALEPITRREGDFDVVCVEHAALSTLIPTRRRASWTVTLHHLASRQAEQVRQVSSGCATRAYWAREAEKSRRLERWIVASYDRTFVCSTDDAAVLGPRAEVVPNGVDPDAFPLRPRPERPIIVFTGSLDYRPNIDGLRWFCDAVLPIVHRSVPDATFQIVGLRPSPAITALTERVGVAVHADVDAVEPFLLGARVAVVPLRIGSGTRLKALEAMAARRPVVGTTIGLAGLGLVDGVHARIADDADGFAAAVVAALVGDEGAAQVAAARRLVEERFSWASIGRAHADHLTAVATASASATKRG